MKPEPLDTSVNFLGQGIPGRDILANLLKYHESNSAQDLPTLDQLEQWARVAKSHWKSDYSGRPDGKACVPWVLKLVNDAVRMWLYRRPILNSRAHVILKSFDLANRGAASCQSTISTAPPVEQSIPTSTSPQPTPRRKRTRPAQTATGA